MDSPGLAAKFQWLNQEVLGIIAPANEIVYNDDDNNNNNAHDESDVWMKAELWEDPGLYPPHIWWHWFLFIIVTEDLDSAPPWSPKTTDISTPSC